MKYYFSFKIFFEIFYFIPIFRTKVNHLIKEGDKKMNIWILYDSKYGNNKLIAETLAGYFNDGNNIQVHYVKKLSQKTVIEGGVDILLIGGPTHLGAPSFTLKRWAKRMTNKLIQNRMQLKKAVIWATHLKDKPNSLAKFSWNDVELKWKRILNNIPAEKKIDKIQGFEIEPVAGRDAVKSGWQDVALQFAALVKNL